MVLISMSVVINVINVGKFGVHSGMMVSLMILVN